MGQNVKTYWDKMFVTKLNIGQNVMSCKRFFGTKFLEINNNNMGQNIWINRYVRIPWCFAMDYRTMSTFCPSVINASLIYSIIIAIYYRTMSIVQVLAKCYKCLTKIFNYYLQVQCGLHICTYCRWPKYCHSCRFFLENYLFQALHSDGYMETMQIILLHIFIIFRQENKQNLFVNNCFI